MIRTRRAAVAATGVLMALSVTACGSSSSGGSTVTPGSGPSGNTIKIENYSFKPSSLTVKPGTKVTFEMEDSGTMHTATGSGNSSFINSPKLTKGQTYTVTFSKAGTYSFICSIHPYMHGKVIVS